MKRTAILAALAAGLAAPVLAQDTPPPGCRWQNFQGEQTLACKDGKGHWRRSGDDLVVGTYPLPKPKPKPAPMAAKPAAATPAAVSAEQAGAPALAEGEAAPATEAAAPSVDDAAVDAVTTPAPDAEPPAQPAPAKKPWWQFIWEGILKLLRAIGLLK